MFSNVEGVKSTSVGYMGGKYEHPTYKDVCTGKTGHAEVVQLTYDPKMVSYKDLLEIFWKTHNPTSLNRQGFDVGSQYRSVIFYHDKRQRKYAIESRKLNQKNYDKKIVTEIKPASNFWKAEEYHQKYLEKHGMGSCRI